MKNKMTGGIKNILLLVGSLALFVFLLLYGLVPYHTYKLNKFSDALLQIGAPSQTEVIQTKKKIGVLSGNGNHCDYYAGMAIATEIEKRDIESYYSDKYKGDAEVKFTWISEKSESELIDGLRKSGIRPNSELVWDIYQEQDVVFDAKHVGVVYIFEHTDSLRFDYRCT